MDDPKNNTFLESVKRIAKRLDELFFQPTANLTDERDRLRAYVSSILLAVISVIFLYGLSRYDLGAPVAPGVPSWWTLVISLLVTLGGYALTRTKYYQWGLGLAFVPMLVVLYGVVFDPPDNFSQVESVTRWIIIPLLFGGLLLPRRAFLLMSLAFVSEPIILIYVLPSEMTQDAISLAAFTLFTALFIGLSIQFQAQLETQALAAVQKKNLAEKEGIIQRLQKAETLQRQRAKIIEASNEINRRLASILDPKQLVDEVINQIRELFHYNYVQLYLIDEAGENLVVAGGTGEAGQLLFSRGHHIPLGKGLVGQAAATNVYVLVDDVSEIGTWISNPLLPNTKTELAVPISVGDTVLGVLDVQHDDEGALTAEDVALLQSVATAVAIALQNARLYEQAHKQAENEAIVNQINQQILGATNIEHILQVAATELGRALKAKNTMVQLAVGTEPGGNGRSNGDKN